jgi:hypothetical protein
MTIMNPTVAWGDHETRGVKRAGEFLGAPAAAVWWPNARTPDLIDGGWLSPDDL